MSAVYTPPMRLLKDENRISASSPGTTRITAHEPRRSMPAVVTSAEPSAVSEVTIWASAIRMGARCTSASTVSPSAIHREISMPR